MYEGLKLGETRILESGFTKAYKEEDGGSDPLYSADHRPSSLPRIYREFKLTAPILFLLASNCWNRSFE